jgi:glycosyltransferase involved in cell wall biosynthesis
MSGVIPAFIIANSQATLDTLLGEAPERKRKVRSRVIHDGCEVPVSLSWPEPNQPLKIGLIGRISPWKGQHVFIQAAAMLRNEFPDVRFQIIGAPLFSEFEYESELHCLTRELQLERQVEFTGFLRDVQSAIQQLQIVVHASTVGEPFGQVVIEGMAAGRPVIATNGGGIPEIVVDQVTGLLVPMNDARALAEAMASLLRNPKKARAMGARGRRRVNDLFTIERSAKAVEQVYLELLCPQSLRAGPADVEPGEAALQARADFE